MRMKNKKLIALRLDPDLLGWYRNQGAGYQSRMQEALRQHMLRTDHPLPGEADMAHKKTATKQGWDTRLVSGDDAPATVQLKEAQDGDIVYRGGGRYVTVSDGTVGDVRLEKIRCPLYDTQVQTNIFDLPAGRREEHLHNPPAITFFQNPNGRSSAFTNMQSSGQLCWPKRFDIDGMRVGISELVDVGEAYLDLRIGEVRCLSIPLKNMERDDDVSKDLANCPVLPRMRFKHVGIDPPLYIPPVQNFRVTLFTGSKSFGSAEIRVQLDGFLYREIQ